MGLPPTGIAPMLAMQGEMPQNPDDFGYEFKWDGYRCLARWDGRRLSLTSRNGIDLTSRFPEVVPMAEALDGPVLLDGEIVAFDRYGRPSFSAIQQRMPNAIGGGRKMAVSSIAYMLFDILHHGGREVMSLPFVERRALLDELKLSGSAWQTPPWHPDGAKLVALAKRRRLEGVIAKRLDSVYVPGIRSRDWIKIKMVAREEFIIGGYTVRRNGDGLGALLVGFYEADGSRKPALRYAGKIGTGFDDRQRRQLQAFLDEHARSESPFKDRIREKAPHWSDPLLVAEIGFSEFTHLGAIRQGRFQGLCADKRPREVIDLPPEAVPPIT